MAICTPINEWYNHFILSNYLVRGKNTTIISLFIPSMDKDCGTFSSEFMNKHEQRESYYALQYIVINSSFFGLLVQTHIIIIILRTLSRHKSSNLALLIRETI